MNKNYMGVAVVALFCFLSLIAKESFFSDELLDKVEKTYGVFAKKRVQKLNSLMLGLKNKSDMQKLELVNNFFNEVKFTSDIKVWGVKDYWATRMEFLGKDRGDCEDFVIAKYFTLKQLGISTKKLYFTYVKAIKFKQAHMVLAYYKTPKSVPLILDNINKKILPATKRNDLIPVYSFNGDSLYLAKQTGLGQMVPSGNKSNKKWLEFIDKIKKGEL